MNNKKTTKKALLSSAVSLLLCLTMLLGTTMAWFTDTVTSSDNKIQSGTLDVALSQLKDTGWVDITEQQEAIFHYDKWEPGFTDVQFLQIRNDGNLALQWEAALNFHCELTCLIDVIEVYVKTGTYGTDLNAPADFAEVEKDWSYAGTLYDFIYNFTKVTNGVLLAGESADLGIALHMQEEAGNAYQNVTLGEFDIQISAAQWTYEKDSFNDQYDAMAKLPSKSRIEVWTVTELQDALAKYENEEIWVMTDLIADDELDNWEPDNDPYAVYYVTKSNTIQLNGHKLVKDDNDIYALFYVRSGAVLNILGDGSITNNSEGYLLWCATGSTIIVDGVGFEDTVPSSAIIYVSGQGTKVNVTNSSFIFEDNWPNPAFNSADWGGTNRQIILGEGVLLSKDYYNLENADAASIVLAEGCIFDKENPVEIDGKVWYPVVKISE